VVVVGLRGEHRHQFGVGAALYALDRLGHLPQFAFAE
jgi:hypothetical protein